MLGCRAAGAFETDLRLRAPGRMHGVLDAMSFLAELKRRRVVRVALVYGAVAFAVLEAGDVIFPLLRLPEWTLSLVLGLLVLGFPVALVLAWAFQLTPEGLQRTPRRTRADEPVGGAHTAATGPVAHDRNAWLTLRTVIAVLLLVGIGGVAGGWFGSWRATRGDGAAGGPLERSIAVLPFTSRSAAGEDAEFFAAGLHDELLTQLSRIPGLAVTSRTSVMRYAGHDRAVPDLARELGVAWVLEGGVQRAGDRLRLNMQLIDGATDRHVWADTYDQVLTVANVFAIQAEIATAIADALQAELSGTARSAIARAPTENLAAYDAYLRGLAHGVWDNEPNASRAFEEAVRLDPAFAVAWAALARARSWLAVIASGTGARTAAGDVDRLRTLSAGARDAAQQARRLAPDAVETRLAEGYVAYYVDRNLEQALRAFENVRSLVPADPQIDLGSGLILNRLGRFEEGARLLERALAADPRNPDITVSLAETNAFLHRLDEASRLADLTLALQPAYHDARGLRLLVRRMAGDTAAVRRVLEEETPNMPAALSLRYAFPHALEAPVLTEEWLRRLETKRDSVTLAAYHLERARLAHLLQRRALQHAHADTLLQLAGPLIARTGLAGSDLSDQGQRLLRASGLSTTMLAYAYLGREAQAVATGREAVALMPRTVDAKAWWTPQEALLETLTVLGRHDEAVEVARALLGHPGEWTVPRLRTEPMLAPLRTHAGFRALAEQR